MVFITIVFISSATVYFSYKSVKPKSTCYCKFRWKVKSQLSVKVNDSYT